MALRLGGSVRPFRSFPRGFRVPALLAGTRPVVNVACQRALCTWVLSARARSTTGTCQPYKASIVESLSLVFEGQVGDPWARFRATTSSRVRARALAIPGIRDLLRFVCS